MVGDDVRTALTIGQFVWAAMVFVFTLGGLAMWVRLKIGSQGREIAELKKDMKEVRENWVTRKALDDALDRQYERIVEAVAERRSHPRGQS